MGKLTNFKISFLEDKDIFHAEEEVTGALKVTLTEPMFMRCLRISFVGKAHVSWNGGSNDDKSSYLANQIFFNKDRFVVGSGDPGSDETLQLGAGSHTFRFQFTLPPEIPSTFEDYGGYIRYYIKASIVKPWKFDHNTKKMFTVLDSLDLNTMPNALGSSGDSQSKSFCCWCCKSGPMELEFYVDRTGYVPGEWITINANVSNASNRHVSKTTAILYRKITYYAQGCQHTLWRNVKSIDGPGCGPGKTLAWENKSLQIPPIPPTEQVHCRILDIEYVIEFVVHSPALTMDLRGRAPILIGTVPLQNIPRNIDDGDSEAPTNGTNHTPPPSFSTLPPALPPNFSMLSMQTCSVPPPSYAAAMDGTVDARDHEDNEFTMGEMEYTPHYTYYDWNQPEHSSVANYTDM